MSKGRLEAFSDGVLAIIITIMVLELKAPRDGRWESLRPIIPVFVSYVLSFLYVGIYWNNHHHLLQAVRFVDGRVLWANLHLLFWLSLIPFVTNWVGDTSFREWPVAAYGFVLLCAAIAYTILVRMLLAVNGRDSLLAKAIGSDLKGKASMAIYVLGVATSFWNPLVAYGLYMFVALIWLFPDRRIERVLFNEQRPGEGI
jgi:TMEM175 potassium channel family protein